MQKGYSNFASVYDKLISGVSYQERASYFDKIILQSQKERGILVDLGCGTGSLSEEFNKLGYEVIGIDISEDMLMIANQKRICSGSDIIYLRQPMQNLDLYGTVDVFVSALDSMNHLIVLEDLKRTFEGVALFLNPQGLFLFDMNTPYKHEEILANHTFVYDYDDTYLVWQNTPLANNTIQIDLDIFNRQKDGMFSKVSDSFCERAYTNGQIKTLLENAGLQLLAIYDSDSERPPQNNSQRLVYVVQKFSK